MSSKPKIVILNCGSFNPLTNMHLRMFELAKDHLVNKMHCTVVEGIISPVNDNYSTSKYIAPAKHRCEMIKRALKPLQGRKHWVRLDEWECRQHHWLRTLDVLRHHREQLKKDFPNDKVALKLLCGADLFETFNVPGLWQDSDIEEILRDYGLVIITRHGSDPLQTLRHSPKAPILTKYEDSIVIVDAEKNGISSTMVREAIAKNESVRYLVDDSVIEYIHKNGLYSAHNAPKT